MGIQMITHRGIDETICTFQGELVEAEILTKITKILRKQRQAGGKDVNLGVDPG